VLSELASLRRSNLLSLARPPGLSLPWQVSPSVVGAVVKLDAQLLKPCLWLYNCCQSLKCSLWWELTTAALLFLWCAAVDRTWVWISVPAALVPGVFQCWLDRNCLLHE
jgi:hypothetical protein